MEIKRLASGTLVDVVGGIAQPLTCDWLVEIPGHPEDRPYIVPCGTRVRSLDGKVDLRHTTCENGHDRHEYGSPEWAADDWAWEMRHREIG